MSIRLCRVKWKEFPSGLQTFKLNLSQKFEKTLNSRKLQFPSVINENVLQPHCCKLLRFIYKFTKTTFQTNTFLTRNCITFNLICSLQKNSKGNSKKFQTIEKSRILEFLSFVLHVFLEVLIILYCFPLSDLIKLIISSRTCRRFILHLAEQLKI